MPTAKIAVTLDKKILKTVDQLVSRKVFPNRSRAVNDALREKIAHLGRGRLAKECAKLSPQEEQDIADEGLSDELRNWPKY